MQALKKFTQSDNSASSASGQGAFLGMAMAEASKVRFSIFAPEARVLQRDVSLGFLRLHVSDCMCTVYELANVPP